MSNAKKQKRERNWQRSVRRSDESDRNTSVTSRICENERRAINLAEEWLEMFTPLQVAHAHQDVQAFFAVRCARSELVALGERFDGLLHQGLGVHFALQNQTA